MKWKFLRDSPYINLSLLMYRKFESRGGVFTAEFKICIYLYVNILKYRFRKY